MHDPAPTRASLPGRRLGGSRYIISLLTHFHPCHLTSLIALAGPSGPYRLHCTTAASFPATLFIPSFTCLTVLPQHSFGSRSPSFLPSRCWRVAPRAGSLPGSQPRNKRLSCTALTALHALFAAQPNIPFSLCPSTSTSSTFTSTLSERLSRLCSTVCCHCPSSVSGLSSAQSALQWCRFLRYIISGFASRSFFLCPAPSIIRRRHPTAAALDRQIILESIPESHSKKPSNRTWQTRLEPDRVTAVKRSRQPAQNQDLLRT